MVEQGDEPEILDCCNRRVPIDHNRELYRERNIMERGIGWFKQRHLLTTRYEKDVPDGRTSPCSSPFVTGCNIPSSIMSTCPKQFHSVC